MVLTDRRSETIREATMSEQGNEVETPETDVDGHIFIRDMEQDVEGHRVILAAPEEEDVEGHVQPRHDLDVER